MYLADPVHMPPPRPGNAGRQPPHTPGCQMTPPPPNLGGKRGCHRLGQPAPESRHTPKRCGSSPTRHAQVLQDEALQSPRPADPAATTAAWKRRGARARVRSGRRGASGGSRGGSGGPARPPGKKGAVRSTEDVSQHTCPISAPLLRSPQPARCRGSTHGYRLGGSIPFRLGGGSEHGGIEVAGDGGLILRAVRVRGEDHDLVCG